MSHINTVYKVPPLVSVHIATLLFGLAGVLGAAVGLTAIEVTFGRTLFASIALLVVWWFSARHDGAVISVLVVFSGVLLAIHWVTFFASIQASTVAIGLVMFSTCPVFVALLEPVFFREPFKPSALLPAVLVLVGVVIISGVHRGELIYARGIMLGIASGASFAVLQLVNRKLTNTAGPVETSMVQNVVATVLLLPIVAGGLTAIQSSQWLVLIFLGVGCTALAHTLFIDALRRIRVATASLIAAGLEPVYGIVLAALFLSQWPGSHVLIGGAIILITVGVMTYSHAKE